MALLWSAALAGLIVVLVVCDIRTRNLDNRLVLLFTGCVVLAPLVHDPGGDRLVLALWSVGAGLLAFAAGLLLYRTGDLGAGDVKLAFGVVAVLMWFGSTAWLIYLGCLIPAVAVSLWLLLRGRRTDAGADVPFGPALLVGVVPAVAATMLIT